MGLAQIQAVGADLPVVKRAAWVSVGMRFGGRESLNQLGTMFQRRAVQRGDLRDHRLARVMQTILRS